MSDNIINLPCRVSVDEEKNDRELMREFMTDQQAKYAKRQGEAINIMADREETPRIAALAADCTDFHDDLYSFISSYNMKDIQTLSSNEIQTNHELACQLYYQILRAVVENQ